MNKVEKEIAQIIDRDFLKSDVGKVVRAFNEACRDAKHVFAFVIGQDGTVEHFSFIPPEALLLELDIFSQDCRDRIIASRDTEYGDLTGEDEEEKDNG